MNIKNKKIILNDEVKEFLTIMEKENFDNKLIKKNYEKSVKNLEVIIDNFFNKRKIDIRADIKNKKKTKN